MNQVISNKGTRSDTTARKLLSARVQRTKFSVVVSAIVIGGAAVYLTVHGTKPQFFHDLHDNTVYFVGWIVMVVGAVKLLWSEWPGDKGGKPPVT